SHLFAPGVMCIVLYFGMSRGNGMFGLGLGLFADIFAAIGVSLLAGGLVNPWRAHGSRSWPQTAGVITYGVIDESNSVTRDREGCWLPGAGAAFLLFGLAVFIWGIPALTR